MDGSYEEIAQRLGVSPLEASRRFESTARLSKHSTLARRAYRERPTLGRVDELLTEKLWERLADMGITIDDATFAARTTKHHSAWALGTELAKEATEPLSSVDREFVCLASCVLWRRTCADRLCVEWIDDWIDEAYQWADDGDERTACDSWLKLWEALRPLLSPEMDSLDAWDTFLESLQPAMNWTQDALESIRFASATDPDLARRGERFAAELLQQLSNEEGHYRRSVRDDRVALLEQSGALDTATREARALIDDYPDHCVGYVLVTDLLTREGSQTEPEKLDQAIELLRTARTRPVVDGPDYDLDARLADVRAWREAQVLDRDQDTSQVDARSSVQEAAEASSASTGTDARHSTGGAGQIDWRYALDGVPSEDYVVANPDDIEDAFDNLLWHLERGSYLSWEAVVREEQGLPLNEAQQSSLEDLMSFSDDEDEPILYIDEFARPRKPWYESVQEVARALLIEPFDPTDSCFDDEERGWPLLAQCLESHAQNLSLPPGAELPVEVVPAEIRHRLELQGLFGLLQRTDGSDTILTDREGRELVADFIDALQAVPELINALDITPTKLRDWLRLSDSDREYLEAELSCQLGLS